MMTPYFQAGYVAGMLDGREFVESGVVVSDDRDALIHNLTINTGSVERALEVMGVRNGVDADGNLTPEGRTAFEGYVEGARFELWRHHG